jgi:large subunit ribosomal protein L18
MSKTSLRSAARAKRKQRIRKKVYGSSERPRLTVFRSGKHIYAQVINDEVGATLVSAATVQPALREDGKFLGNIEGAKRVGKAVAEAAQNAGVKQVVFDRNGFLYHGRVRALAEAAREAGLEF